MNCRKDLVLLVTCLVTVNCLAVPPAPPAGKVWELVDSMSDEFNGSFDTTKWAKNYSGWAGRKPGLFVTSAVTMGDGNMRITADLLDNPYDGWTHQGGLVRSLNKAYDTWSPYFECRMMANTTFMSSTFWMINQRQDETGCDKRVTELDITETVGFNSGGSSWINNMMHRMNSNTHSRDIPSGCDFQAGSIGNNAELGELASANYHVYGCWWKSPTEILFYLDGNYVGTVTPVAPFTIGMNMRFVVETYDWNPPPADGGMNGSFADRTTYYDWVHTYKLIDGDDTSTPYWGTPVSLPGLIEAEEYDIGLEGFAYHDTTAGNSGGLFRTDDVDIEARDGGYNVGWIADGEWLEYTVNATTGTYDLTARVASEYSDSSFNVFLDDTQIATVNVPNTTDWGIFDDVTVPDIFITGADDVILRLEFSCPTGGQNVNWIEFTAIPSTPYSGTPISLPGKLQAEEYDLGGEGIAYHDTTAGNTGSDFRADDVDITDQYGGHVVAWIVEDEWLKYTVDATAGTYDITFRAATGTNNRTVTLTLDDNVLGTALIPNMGWSTFSAVTLEDVVIPATSSGKLQIDFHGGVNVDWIDFTLLKGDVNFSGAITIDDLNILASQWLTDCLVESVCADLDYNGKVDLSDFEILSAGWMMP